jgi:hypothetical protein
MDESNSGSLDEYYRFFSIWKLRVIAAMTIWDLHTSITFIVGRIIMDRPT